MSKIIVLIGPPACGKTTLARKMHEEDNNKVIVNRDDIRAARGTYWIPDQEKYISDIEEFEIRSAIKHGLTPIIDATNLNPKTIEKWENLSVELDVDLDKVYLPYITFAEALERDNKRAKEGGRAVGEKILRRFYAQYYPDRYFGEMNPKCTSTEPDNTLPPAVIFDLDSTIMFANNRGPYEYEKAGNDTFDPKARWFFDFLIDSGVTPIIITGREMSEQSQLAIHKAIGFEERYQKVEKYPYILLGRVVGDRRKGLVVKEELYDTHVAGKFNTIMAFDDDQDVINMYKSKGIFASKV